MLTSLFIELNPFGHRIVAGAIVARLGHRASRAETSGIRR
jgi:hypothetical protein